MAGAKKKQTKKATTGPVDLQVHLRMNFSLASAPSHSRWPGDRPVPGATIAVDGTKIRMKTDSKGNAKLPRAGLPKSPFKMMISPDPSQLNASGPAGPTLARGMKSPPTFMYRTFEVTVSIDAKGFVSSPAPAVVFTKTPGGPPAHALIFAVTPNVLTIDWKPDWIQSANHDAVRVKPIDCITIHQTGWPPVIGSVINTFTTTTGKHRASANYVIDTDGHVIKMVSEDFPAWHAGASFWQGQTGVNGFSVGIEILHTDQTGTSFLNLTPAPTNFEEDQYLALLRLLPALRAAFPAATRQRAVGHSDVETRGGTHFQIGTSRPGDPGFMFEWHRLEAAGLARTPDHFIGPPSPTLYGLAMGSTKTLTVPASSADVTKLKDDLSLIGYSVSDTNGFSDGPVFGVSLQRALARFQTRFFSGSRIRTGMTLGVLDFTTAAMLFSVLQDTLP